MTIPVSRGFQTLSLQYKFAHLLGNPGVSFVPLRVRKAFYFIITLEGATAL
jgi:hypothetical protein